MSSKETLWKDGCPVGSGTVVCAHRHPLQCGGCSKIKNGHWDPGVFEKGSGLDLAGNQAGAGLVGSSRLCSTQALYPSASSQTSWKRSRTCLLPRFVFSTSRACTTAVIFSGFFPLLFLFLSPNPHAAHLSLRLQFNPMLCLFRTDPFLAWESGSLPPTFSAS